MRKKLLIAGAAVAVNTAANLAIDVFYYEDEPRTIGLIDVLLIVFGPAPLAWWGHKLLAESKLSYWQ